MNTPQQTEDIAMAISMLNALGTSDQPETAVEEVAALQDLGKRLSAVMRADIDDESWIKIDSTLRGMILAFFVMDLERRARIRTKLVI